MQLSIKSCKIIIACLILFGFSAYSAADQDLSLAFGEARVQINNKTLTVEYAYNNRLRARGLMFRQSLCQDCGMLFNFGYPREVGMWMKNTPLPLSVAYFTQDGTITDIIDMQPLTLDSHMSSRPVQYALEMPQGWFKVHGVEVNDTITILSTAQ